MKIPPVIRSSIFITAGRRSNSTSGRVSRDQQDEPNGCGPDHQCRIESRGNRQYGCRQRL